MHDDRSIDDLRVEVIVRSVRKYIPGSSRETHIAADFHLPRSTDGIPNGKPVCGSLLRSSARRARASRDSPMTKSDRRAAAGQRRAPEPARTRAATTARRTSRTYYNVGCYVRLSPFQPPRPRDCPSRTILSRTVHYL